MGQFQCLRCGQCCRKFLGQCLEDTVAGLALFPNEIQYFPREMVSPFRGKGKYPEDPGFRVYMYQLNREPCPNLQGSANTSSCAIYPHRPVICRCYPFTVLGWLDKEVLTQPDSGCTAFRERVDSRIEISKPQAEWAACLSYAIQVGVMDLTEHYWIFDLEDHEWHVSVPPVSYVENYLSRLADDKRKTRKKAHSQ